MVDFSTAFPPPPPTRWETGTGVGGTEGTGGVKGPAPAPVPAPDAGPAPPLPPSGGVKNDVDLPPPDDADKSKQSQALGNLGMFSDSQVNADIYACMALFQKLAQTMRDSARLERTAQLQSEVAAMQSAADQMRESAALRFAGSVISGALQIAGGALQMGFSAASAAQTIKGAGMDAGAKNLLSEVELGKARGTMGPGLQASGTQMANQQMLDGAKFSATGAKYQGYGQAMGGITGGLGGIASSGFEFAASESDAKKAELDAKAKMAETGAQHASDMMQQTMEVIRDMRDKLQSIEQAAVETNRGIARNI